ncbi:class II fructose-bisphosphate aldolase [Aestuariivivens sediminicola]|uniref:class II fructose-bisphosphate aldolase n=1 Tax=Aestuariivivens sediminicola TaxID=2913560 RepID=UPI001F58AE78|nr:class II fructose-bisphosphate aldolase [Aestuariivivens sediminicola]
MKSKLKDVLLDLRKRKRALMAFNLQNLYHLEAAKLVSERLKVPLIIQFSERYLRLLDEKYGIEFLIKTYGNDFIYFHLDHCIDLQFIKRCIDFGFDSVMYDGSAFDIETNMKNTKIIIAHASKVGCLVEGELGKVSGVEDGFGEEGSSYAEIEEIETYVKETKIDLMALGIGNAHGFYDDLKGLKTAILKEASNKLDDQQFYVLHGGTGLPDSIIKETIDYGVVKINVSTQLKKHTMDLLKSYTSGNDLYNEISFNKLMTEGLSQLFEEYLMKYTQ